MIKADNKLLWSPAQSKIKSSSMYFFKEVINKKYSLNIQNYEDLHRWSIENRSEFWSEVWDFYKLIGVKGSLPYLKSKNKNIKQCYHALPSIYYYFIKWSIVVFELCILCGVLFCFCHRARGSRVGCEKVRQSLLRRQLRS